MAGKQSGKDKKNDVGVEDEEVNDTNVKTLSLDFECGQRVLSQVHILCQVTLFVYARSLSVSLCECVRANVRMRVVLHTLLLLFSNTWPHTCAQGFRDQASKAMKGLKSQEYQLAKEEVVKLQAQIDAKRIEQIERISGTQSRQLTALEKVFLWGGLMSVVLPDVVLASGCCMACKF